MTDVLVVAELFEGAPRKSTYAAITAGKEIAEGTGGKFDILSIGEGAGDSADELAKYGAGKVFKAEISGGYVCEKYAPTVAEVGKGYDVVLGPATIYGKDLFPRVAAKLDAGIAPDVSSIGVDGGKLEYRRPIYAGNVFATMEITTDKHVVSVRQSEFDPAKPGDGTSSTEDVEIASDETTDKVEFIDMEVVKSERPDLTEAEVVVSGGRAFKSAENFENILEPLVDTLGAAMGASRAACDAGYVANDLQVGQTGKVVAPKLYIAIGISGAIQHLAGMKGSKVIVAINKDPEAPIAAVSDYFLTADLFKVVPDLTEQIKKLQS